MKSKCVIIARVVLGLIFFVFGLNGFLQFIPVPPMPENVQVFFTGMMQTGYFFPVLKGTEVVCGALLLTGYYIPLSLVVLAPIVLHIVLFHAFMAPSGLPMAFLCLALGVYLAWAYRAAFRPILRAKG